jgi:hypothetical protein
LRKLEEALDPNNPGAWTLVSESPEFRHYELDLGDGTVIRRTEHKHTAEMLDNNQRLLNDSMGKRWGDGQIAARIPLNLYFSSGFAEARKQNDKKWIKRFLNDSDNRKFRTFNGKV